MQTDLEQAITIIKSLPVKDYDKLRRAIDEQEKSKRAKPRRKDEFERDAARHRKSEKWLAENREK